jgi:hypothetical protein
MTNESCLVLLAGLELDQYGAQSDVTGKIGVLDFPNRNVRFWQISAFAGNTRR